MSKAAHPVRWAVSLIRKRAEELGTIEAPEQTAIAKAALTRDR